MAGAHLRKPSEAASLRSMRRSWPVESHLEDAEAHTSASGEVGARARCASAFFVVSPRHHPE